MKRKSHKWVIVDKEIPGLFRCSVCRMSKFQFKGSKTVYARDGVIDNSDTVANCFVLSKD